MIGLVFLVVLLALVWGVVVVLGLPLTIAVIPTVVAVLAVGAVVALRIVQARKAAGQLEGSLQAQGEQQEAAVRPDQKPEVKAMRAEFNKALASLKTAKGGKGGASALAVLPWYLILGPPGGGKSTALRNSGLQFPYAGKRGGAVKGVGGTRNCDWWFTNEAILLDTAGRYAVEEEDHDEWISFLDSVVKARPKKPINGLIVAISISELMGAEEEAAERGTQLRERVDEVLGKLRLNVPVYVLFTKCDLVAGFVEMYGDLGRTERGQVWGFTEPLRGRTEGAGAIFQERFAELLRILEHRAILRLQKHRRLAAREKLWQFPRELGALRANLSEFIGALFAESPVTDTPPLRGVYFTSGTQEGKPFDRVMRSLAEAFGVAGASAPEEEGSTEARSYFLKDLLTNVVFPDQDLAVASSSEALRQRRLRLGAIAGAFALALVFSLLPAWSFSQNLALVRETEAALTAARGASPRDLPEATRRLTRLRAQVEKLRQYAEEGPPVTMRLGLYQGEALLAEAGTAHAELVKRLFVAEVLVAEETEVRDLAGGPELTEATVEVGQAIEALKLHLLLTTPAAEGEPPREELPVTWVAEHVVGRWTEAGSLKTQEVQAEALRQVQLYAQLLARNSTLAFPRQQALVRTARRALAKVPVAQLTLSRVIAEPVFEDLRVSLPSLTGNSRFLKASRGVRGAFTRKAWEGQVRDMLENLKDDTEGWVLGLSKSASATELRAEYFRLYLSEWRQFIDSVRVEPPRGSNEALAMLEELTHKPSPYTSLFAAVATNTKVSLDSELVGGVKSTLQKTLKNQLSKLGPLGAGLADAGTQALRGDPATAAARELETGFAGLARFGYAAPPPEGQPAPRTDLVVYLEDLEKLLYALRTSLENPQEMTALTTLLSMVRVKVKSSVEQQEPGWRPTIERLVWPPISWLTRTTLAVAAEDSGAKWCSQVATPFQGRLAGHYPFRREGKDASLEDTAEFYRPGGTVDGFYEEVLKKDVQRSGARFEFVKSMGDAPAYSTTLLQFLRRSKEIQSALFPPQSPEPRVDFSIQVHPARNVASTTLTIDGESFEYRNGQEEFRPMKWPGPQKGSGASVRMKSKQGVVDVVQFQGDWALFRLLEAGRLTTWPGERTFAVTWTAPNLDSEVRIDFKPARTDNPFRSQRDNGSTLLDLLRSPAVPAPSSIGLSSPPCRRQ